VSPWITARQAVRALRGHRGWTSLTVFGVVWGTASLVLLTGWGEGFRRMLDDGLSRTGRNLVYAWPGRVSEEYSPAADRRALWLTMADVEAVQRRARIPERVTPESRSWNVVSWGQTSLVRDVRGIVADTVAVRGVRLAAGRPLTPVDVEQARRVAILGSRAREQLIGPRPAIGQAIRIQGRSYTVVGLLAPVGTELARDRTEIDEQVWIPISAFFGNGSRYGTDIDIVDTILFQIGDRAQYDAACAEVRAILVDRLDVSPTDREAVLFASAVAALRAMPFEETTGFLGILAIATLLIAGVGVMNMMLVSVHERRMEIGLRLALGGRRGDVVVQFLAETMTVIGLGGVLGLAIGVSACLVLGAFQTPDLIPVPVFRARVVTVALLVLAGIGLAAGAAPAWRASRVDPSITLRTR